MPGPYYASVTEQSTTPLYKIGAVEKAYVSNTDDVVKLIPRGYIDVRRDFSWTVSPKNQILDKIPAVYLVEREQLQNSLISSALYYVNAIISSSWLDDSIDEVLDKITSLLAKFDQCADTSNKNAKQKFNDFKNNIRKIAATSNDQAILGDRLKSYIGIYYTQPTGFKYVLPYLDNSFIKQSNSFGSSQQNRPLFSNLITDTMIGAADTIASGINFFTPGTYIEKPKYFQYPEDGDTFDISFPLLNTFTSNNYLPYVQNYELLWILSYQNKPYRTSFSRILPPKLYSIYIPGVKYIPYAYINNMSVDFVGTKRLLDVTLPTGQTVKAPIPEAYQVSLTVKSLLADTGNAMVDNGFTSSVIQTSVI
jgi:hypothetical protein